MRRFWNLLASWGPLGVFTMATVESMGVPNPGGTDLLLLVVTIASPANAWLCATLAVVGSLAGTVVFYEILRKGGERFLLRRTASGRGLWFREWFSRYGMLTVFIPALLPIPGLPFKFFAACAAAMRVSRSRFFLVLAVARVPRYFALAYLGATLGESSLTWVKGHLWILIAFAVVLFAGLYALIVYFERKRLE